MAIRVSLPTPTAIPCSPKLRGDVRFHARPGDDAHVVVEDAKRGRYYRVGVDEYVLLREFDGLAPLDVAVSRARQKYPTLELDVLQAIALAQWLEASQLAYPLRPSNSNA